MNFQSREQPDVPNPVDTRTMGLGAPASEKAFAGKKRYLSGKPQHREGLLGAARDYVANLGQDRAWLYRKPFDSTPHNLGFFDDLYPVLGLIGAMRVRPGGRVLDVGCGPGWTSEILAGLGYDVDGLEPAADMIAIARERLAGFLRNHRIEPAPAVRFHCSTLEDLGLEDGTFDGILCRASLHHVLDEDAGVAQCFRLLKPGGVFGVSEGAWMPGHRASEAELDEEMRRYGTLENPFTTEYLDHLLDLHGFRNVERYHGVFGLVPASQGDAPVRTFAASPAEFNNNLTARKPLNMPDSSDIGARTAADIKIKGTIFDPEARQVRIAVSIRNTGETVWLSRPGQPGHVTITLRQNSPGSPDFREPGTRFPVPKNIWPSEELDLNLPFFLTEDVDPGPWFLDLVSEQLFWFSQRGTEAAEVRAEATG
jgi:SAM-dependent methyltransferase